MSYLHLKYLQKEKWKAALSMANNVMPPTRGYKQPNWMQLEPLL